MPRRVRWFKTQCAVPFYFFKSRGGGSLGVSWGCCRGGALGELHRDCSVASISRLSTPSPPLPPLVPCSRFCRHACQRVSRGRRDSHAIRRTGRIVAFRTAPVKAWWFLNYALHHPRRSSGRSSGAGFRNAIVMIMRGARRGGLSQGEHVNRLADRLAVLERVAANRIIGALRISVRG